MTTGAQVVDEDVRVEEYPTRYDGMLVGTALERMRFDGQRTAVRTRYELALREWKTYRMAFERCSLDPSGAPDECESPMTSRARCGAADVGCRIDEPGHVRDRDQLRARTESRARAG